MRIRGILEEGLSKILFHATSIRGASSIFKNKSIKASRLGDSNYVSFSRNRTGQYPLFMGDDMRGTQDPIIVFEFDGGMIGANHRASAIDPFHDEHDASDDWSARRGINYQEDRVFLGKKSELNFNDRAIRKIHVIVNGDSPTNNLAVQGFNGPRVEFYQTIRDFMQGKSIEKPSATLSWAEVQGAIESFLYNSSRKNKEEQEKKIAAYAKVSRENLINVLRFVYQETGSKYNRLLDFFSDN